MNIDNRIKIEISNYMKILLSTLVLVLTMSSTSIGQGLDQLKESATTYIDAMEAKDYASIVDLTYDNIIEMAGDKDYYVKLIKAQRDAYEEGGMVLKSAQYIETSPVVKAGDELHAIVKVQKEYLIAQRLYQGPSYLLAITEDKGKSWKFVDLETFDEEGIKDFVPSYNTSLPFPVQEGATLVDPDKE